MSLPDIAGPSKGRNGYGKVDETHRSRASRLRSVAWSNLQNSGDLNPALRSIPHYPYYAPSQLPLCYPVNASALAGFTDAGPTRREQFFPDTSY